ncbi:MAG: hypothetical protein ABSG42_05530 [Nitrospirota bacterium]
MSISKEEIYALFRVHCSGCEGLCCKNSVFTLFNHELEGLKPDRALEFTEDGTKNIRRVKMGALCPFSRDKGCEIELGARPLDCLTYPIYPSIRYKESACLIDGMTVHRSCPSCESIAADAGLLRLLRSYWEEQLSLNGPEAVSEWFGQDEYWDSENVIRC